MATSTPCTRGAKPKQNGCKFCTFSGVPSAPHWQKLSNGDFTPTCSGGPNSGIMPTQPLPSQVYPLLNMKGKLCRTEMQTSWAHHPCILWGGGGEI